MEEASPHHGHDILTPKPAGSGRTPAFRRQPSHVYRYDARHVYNFDTPSPVYEYTDVTVRGRVLRPWRVLPALNAVRRPTARIVCLSFILTSAQHAKPTSQHLLKP